VARKSRNKPTKSGTSLADSQSTVKAIQSLLSTPEFMNYVSSGALRGVREKILSINFQTIRNLVARVPIINAVIIARLDQIQQFSTFTTDNKGARGWTLVKVDKNSKMSKKDEETQKELSGFFAQTGFEYDAEREDDFGDYLALLAREVLTIDQISTELQPNRKGEVAAFWALDGALIKRVIPGAKVFPADVRFVQEYENKIYNTYRDKDLLFDYKHKRADIRYRGWGYSQCEMCIDLITTLLFGYAHTRDQFLKDKVPKGFISVMGDAGKPQLDAIRNYWHSAMSSAGGRWNIPILPSGKEGVGIDFKSLGQSNRDMEYHKTMMFVSSVVASVFSIDLAELGIKSDDSSALIGESSESRVKHSKDKGLGSLLAFLSQHVNKILRKLTTEWEFKFVGLEAEDEKAKIDLYKTKIESYMTINEIRKEEGLEPLTDSYADVVLNVQGVQIYQSQQAGGGMGGDAGGPGGQEEGQPGIEGQEEQDAGASDDQDTGDQGGDELTDNKIDWEHLFKKGIRESRNSFIKSLQDRRHGDVHIHIE
jgi:hypothetical protein